MPHIAPDDDGADVLRDEAELVCTRALPGRRPALHGPHQGGLRIDRRREHRLEDDRLGQSSLILADVLEKVPTKSIGTGPFVIGTSKVRPRVGDSFSHDEKLGIYLQVYNFEADEKTKKADGTIEYVITKNGSEEKVFEYIENISTVSGGASQVVIEKLLPLQSMEPGQYTLRMKVVDKKRNQTLTPSATFTVT